MTVLKTCFAGGASTTFLYRILILSLRIAALALGVPVAIVTGLREAHQ